MIGTSFGEWILIRLSVIFLRYTPLLYSAGLSASIIAQTKHPKLRYGTYILGGLLLAESGYYAFIWRPYQKRLKTKARHPKPLSRNERKILFDHALINVQDPEYYLQWWFLGSDIEDIHRDNVREFLLWAYFERGDENFGELEEELDGMIEQVEGRLGGQFKDGRGPAKSLRLTIDPIETTYRGLNWYLIIFVVDLATHAALKYHGFQYYSSTARVFPPRPQRFVSSRQSTVPSLSYWYKPHASNNQQLPVVFFHGIGIGLLTYIRFLADLHKAGNQGIGIIAPELLPISFRLTDPPPDKAEFLDQITTLIDHHRWDTFAAVSHSYGSILITHLLSSPSLQHRVPSITLIDPVSIMLHLPNVAYNFTRRLPRRANEWQLWYFASTDPGVAHCLGRHFFWRDNIIWKEDLLARRESGVVRGTRKVAVSLSGRDLIVDTAAVAQYLEGEDGIEVVFIPHLDHAQVFDDPPSRDKLVHLTTLCCTKPE